MNQNEPNAEFSLVTAPNKHLIVVSSH